MLLRQRFLVCQSRLQEQLFKYLDEHKSDEHGDAADESPVLNEVSFPALLIPKFEESFEAMPDDVKSRRSMQHIGNSSNLPSARLSAPRTMIRSVVMSFGLPTTLCSKRTYRRSHHAWREW